MEFKEVVRLLQSRNLKAVARGVKESGTDINYRYLLRIAAGQVDNPPVLTVEALAKWMKEN